MHKKFIDEYNGKRFIIEEDLSEAGAYFYVCDGEKSICDYLQDSISVCKELANEKYFVPMNDWRYLE